MDSKEEAALVMMIKDIVKPTLCVWLQLITREVCYRFKKNTDTVCSWLGDISEELRVFTFSASSEIRLKIDLQR